jgi:GrpB-like predicted nucleotidyltransferase (UPF0157 family)
MLGLPRNTVQLQPYNPVWKTIFERDANLIRNVIGKYVIDIQHIGSTSIEGLDAKPVIDIAIGVESLDIVDEIALALKDLGYFRLKVIIDGKVVFAKDTDVGRTHYLHLENYNGNHWNDHLLFRDYLRSHAGTVKAYMKLKRELAKEFSADVSSYTDKKKLFVDEILLNARNF